jgi:transcriptional regulator with XRE-family HTH domain
MSSTKIIRAYYGFTQAQLSVFLGISDSLLRLVETGRRILPTQALLKLNELHAHMQQAVPHSKHKAITTHIQKHAPQHSKLLHAQHKELLYQKALHQKKMDAMQTKHTQALQALTLVHALQLKAAKQTTHKKDMAWLAHIEKNASIVVKNTHPILQAHAQIKMNMLEGEVAAVGELLGVGSGK